MPTTMMPQKPRMLATKSFQKEMSKVGRSASFSFVRYMDIATDFI